MDKSNVKAKTIIFVSGLILAIAAAAAVTTILSINNRYSRMTIAYASIEGMLLDKTGQLNKANDQLAEIESLAQKMAAEALDKITETKAQNKELTTKLERFKTREDWAQRDLEAYILKKYRVVPAVVAKEIAYQVVKQTKKESVPFPLIVGLIEVESQFMPWAISKKGARGLMQVMPFWVKRGKANLGIKSKYDLHDISTNITAGIKVFKIHLKEANNDINKGLYLYVGKDKTYASKVFNAMGRFVFFRSTLDTALRDEAGRDAVKDATERKRKVFEKTEPSVVKDTVKKKTSLKYKTFNKEAYARANKKKGYDMGTWGRDARLFRS